MKNLAETSNYPGKTRNLYFYRVADKSGVYLVDPPGYGFAEGNKKEVDKWNKLMTFYIKNSNFFHRAFILIDGQHGFK